VTGAVKAGPELVTCLLDSKGHFKASTYF